ncbi:MAG: response regulator [Candidatus Omnitrophica bacterium]|nr:response regulator [Candidatus Omnitrophota bacterium]
MGKRIMIIDDEVDLVKTVQLRLESNGYEVSSSVGERSVQDAVSFKPDLILLDVIMPGMDGFAIIRELKRNPDTSKVPVVIFSGKPKAAMIELFGPEGVAGYVAKPYDPKDLFEQIKKILGA